MDQRGDRKMVMGEKDNSYERRVDNNTIKKQQGEGSSKAGSSSNDADVDENDNVNEDESENEDNDQDKEYAHKERHKKKDSVLLELPKDIMNSPELCAMLDRKAVGLVFSLLRSGKIDGQQVDLNQFSISRPTLEGKRIENRTVLMMQEMHDFEKKKPEYAGLH